MNSSDIKNLTDKGIELKKPMLIHYSDSIVYGAWDKEINHASVLVGKYNNTNMTKSDCDQEYERNKIKRSMNLQRHACALYLSKMKANPCRNF